MSQMINETSNGSNYYVVDGVMYISTFPLEWVHDHIPTTGPKECGNCEFYGSRKEIFIGYCLNCAQHVYDNKRGYGFNCGSEKICKQQEPDSATQTYLKNINLDEFIGPFPFYSIVNDDSSEDEYTDADAANYALDKFLHNISAMEIELMEKELEEMNDKYSECPDEFGISKRSDYEGYESSAGYDSY